MRKGKKGKVHYICEGEQFYCIIVMTSNVSTCILHLHFWQPTWRCLCGASKSLCKSSSRAETVLSLVGAQRSLFSTNPDNGNALWDPERIRKRIARPNQGSVPAAHSIGMSSSKCSCIRHAYWLIDQHHPDRNGSSPNDKQAQRILEAWEVLRDPTRRKQYDAELSGKFT